MFFFANHVNCFVLFLTLAVLAHAQTLHAPYYRARCRHSPSFLLQISNIYRKNNLHEILSLIFEISLFTLRQHLQQTV